MKIALQWLGVWLVVFVLALLTLGGPVLGGIALVALVGVLYGVIKYGEGF